MTARRYMPAWVGLPQSRFQNEMIAMRANSACIEFVSGRYRCRNTRRVFTANAVPPITCSCGRHGLRIIQPVTLCPLSTVVAHLTPHGLSRLQRCRAARCGLMLPVEDRIACVGMGGGKCGWAAKWVACLNGETAFPNGEPSCPHWKGNADLPGPASASSG